MFNYSDIKSKVPQPKPIRLLVLKAVPFSFALVTNFSAIRMSVAGAHRSTGTDHSVQGTCWAGAAFIGSLQFVCGC